jgi:hypothetical protein
MCDCRVKPRAIYEHFFFSYKTRTNPYAATGKHFPIFAAASLFTPP